MRRFLILLPVLLAGMAQAQTLTTVTATNITDQTGQTKLAAGRICFLATDAADKPISFQMGGGGQVIKVPSCGAVTAGAVSLTVPNPGLTSPANIAFRVTVTDVSGGEVLKYTGVQFSGGAFNFDNYVPAVGTIAVGVSVPNLTVGTLNVTTCSACSLLISVFGRVGTVTAQTGDYNFGQISGVLALNQTPLTTLGDLLFANSTPALARLGGNTTTTRMFLSQTGDGVNSAAPVWLALQAADIPDISATYLKLTGGTMSGNILFPNGTKTAPPINSAAGMGFYFGTNNIFATNGTTPRFLIDYGHAAEVLDSGWCRTWSSGVVDAAAIDTRLCRDAPNTLAQVNGTNAQTLIVYGSFTDASNYERLRIFVDSGAQHRPTIIAEKLGAATSNGMDFGVPTGTNYRFAIGGTNGLILGSGGIQTYAGIAAAGWGASVVHGSISATAQAASLATTSVYASAPAGLYQVCYYTAISQAATTSSALQATVTWTDGTATVQTQVGPNLTANTVGTKDSACVPVESNGGNISLAIAYTSVGGTAMQFRYRATATRTQ